MSHFTTVKTVIRDQEMLTDTLKQLHYTFQEGEKVPIRGYMDNKEYGQVVINTGSEYDIGFQKQRDNSFSICTDWWGVEGNTSIRENSFVQQLNQRYSYNSVKKQVVEKGYIIEEETENEKGVIEIVVCEPM